MLDRNKFSEFQKSYIETIAPYYSEIEKFRLNIYKKLIKHKHSFYIYLTILISFIILFAFIGAFFIVGDANSKFTSCAFVGFGCLIFFSLKNFLLKYYSIISEYKTNLKQNFYSEILKKFGISAWKYADYKMDNGELTNHGSKYFVSTSITNTHKSDYKYTHESSQNFELNKLCAKIDISEIKKSGLFQAVDEVSFDDEFIGKYNDTEYRVSETSVYVYNHKNEPIITFHGIILLFNYFKKTAARTTVKQSFVDIKYGIRGSFKFIATVFAVLFFACSYISMSSGRIDLHSALFFSGLVTSFIILVLIISCLIIFISNLIDKITKGVTLESTYFNRLFSVCSEDQTEARYVLDTAFMERFYNLKKAFRGNFVSCSFYGDKLMIAISTDKDAFEIGNLDTSIKDPKCLLQFYKEMNSIREIIDILKVKSTKKLPN